MKSLFGVPELLKDCISNISCAIRQVVSLRTRLPVKRPKPSLSVVFNLTIKSSYYRYKRKRGLRVEEPRERR